MDFFHPLWKTVLQVRRFCGQEIFTDVHFKFSLSYFHLVTSCYILLLCFIELFFLVF